MFNAQSLLVSSFWLSLLLFYLRFFYVHRKTFKFAWNNKGFFLPVLPVVGTTWTALVIGKKPDLITLGSWLYKHVGAPINTWIGHEYHYVTLNADELKIILSHPKCLNKSRLYNDLQNFYGKNSLAFLAQEEWKARRKHFLKGFKPIILKGFMGTFYGYSCELAEELKGLNGALVSYEHMHKFVFTTFCATAMGLDIKKFADELIEFGNLREKIEQAIGAKVVSPFIPYSIWINFFPSGRRTAEYMERSKVIIEKIIRERKIELEKNQEYVANNNEVPLLDLILSYNQEIMTDEQTYQEMVLFASAAIETSSYVLYFGFIILAMHPDIQEILYNEVIREIGDQEISAKNIARLKYTEATICEVMRLVPSVPFIARIIGDDIDIGGKVIPKGANILVNIYLLHRVAEYWENPEKFDPARFLPENLDKIKPFSYMPFSQGPRDCIGKQHAMTLLKITFANMIRNFKMLTKHKSVDEFDLSSSITIYSTHPLDLHFATRTKS
ncbi:unnamed protein product [Ceutorhynchus assimilis]|uniref:Cytochrome P450 n=1 Tax=Ceutorhynchus assimilis TaxID=467358 RepID=A0A9N9MT60_9CUCU|nr:unnamed protein product [Ceutorhynchus assimilis]